jgi:tetratricopeptide (TPR) repeat protein
MKPCSGRLPAIFAVLILGTPLFGCSGGAAAENQRQLQQQQGELDQLKKDVATLQAQQSTPSYNTGAGTSAGSNPPPGGCDTAVMRVATRKGGERFAATDFTHALGYYQDALTACPANAQAQLNVARTFEALGDRTQAIAHYKLASEAAGADDADAVRQAREAIARLDGSS